MRLSSARRIRTFAIIAIALFLAQTGAAAWEPSEFERHVTEFNLENGMKFLVMERHDVPVMACHIHANVGSVDEVKGITGVAHLLEHMSFRGTRTVGTTDYEAERKLMCRMDEIVQLMERVRGQRRGR